MVPIIGNVHLALFQLKKLWNLKLARTVDIFAKRLQPRNNDTTIANCIEKSLKPKGCCCLYRSVSSMHDN